MAGNTRRILLNTGYRVLADVLGKIASVALYIVMARRLGSEEFGVFAFGLSFVTLVTALASFGQDRILTREVARDHRLVDAYFANTIVLKLALSVPVLAVAVAVLGLVAEPETRDVAALLGVAVIAEQLMSSCFSTFQAYERLAYIPVALGSQRLLMAIWGIVALLHGAGVIQVAAIYLVTTLVGLALALWLLFARVVRPRLGVTPATWKALMVAAFPIGAAGVFGTLLFRADMAMLAAFKPAQDVGEYAAAYRLFEATLFLSWGVSAAIYPVFSRLTLHSTPPVGLIFERALKLAVALTLPLAVGAVVLAGPLIDLLYGPEFDASTTALVLLAPAVALYPIAHVAGYLLVSQDRQKVLVPIYAALAAENILLNLVLIPAYSLNGAAAGTSISLVLETGLLMVFSVRLLGGLDWTRMFAGPVLASALAGLVMALQREHFAVSVSTAGAVYLVSLLLFERYAYPEDARAIRELFPRGARTG